MPNITLHNISDDLYQRLKEMAGRNHRSMSDEIIACLEKAITLTIMPPKEQLAAAEDIRQRVKVKNLSVNEIQAFKQGGTINVFNETGAVFYCIPASVYEAMLELVDDIELLKLIEERKAEESVQVRLDE